MFKTLLSLGISKRKAGIIAALFQWLNSLLILEPIMGLSFIIIDHRIPNGLLMIATIHIILVISSCLFSSFFSGQWATAATSDLQHRFIHSMLAKYALQPAQQLNQIIQNGIGTIKQVAVFYETIIPTLVEIGLTGLIAVIVTGFLNPLSLLIPVISLLGIGLGMMVLNGRGNHRNAAYIRSFTKLGGRFLNDMSALKELIMYHRQAHYATAFSKDSEYFRQKTMGVLAYQLQTLTIMDFFIYSGIGCFALAQLIAVDRQQLSLAGAISLTFLMATWLISIRRFGYFIHVFHSLFPKLQRLFSIINSDQSVNDRHLATPVKSLSLNGSVSYQEKPLVKGLNLQLQPGEVIGLAGASGSGKTTISKVLLGVLPPLSGQVMVNGQPLTDYSLPTWWQHIGYLGPQTTFLDGTLADNLLLTDQNQTWQAELAKFGLCQFVQQLPNGWATQVGQNASRLSPGQKQQLALARELLSHKDVYLFDEISANIDPQNAKIISDCLQRLAKTKLVCQITHKVDDLKPLHQIVYLDHQHVIYGSFSTLQEASPAFKQMIEEQQRLIKEVLAN